MSGRRGWGGGWGRGYKPAFLADGGEVKAVAGFRVSECLARGKFVYADDLVSKKGGRSKGHGGVGAHHFGLKLK